MTFNTQTQDIDPTDWLRTVAANLSGSPEVTLASGISVMAPNPDQGLFGNPEDPSKFVLTSTGQIAAMPFAGVNRRGLRGAPSNLAWSVADYLPPGCSAGGFDNVKMGMAGRFLRVVDLGLWQSTSKCGVEITALSPPAMPPRPPVSVVALVRLVVRNCSTECAGESNAMTMHFQIIASVNSTNSSVINLRTNGSLFYSALRSQSERYGFFVAQGADAQIPGPDRRYTDTAAALLTMYMNLDRGDIEEYGGGKFWNV